MEEPHDADGSAAPQKDLRALTAAVYRPDATPDDVLRLRRAQEELAGRVRPAPAPPAAEGDRVAMEEVASRPRRSRIRGTATVVVAVLVAGALGFGLGSVARPSPVATAPPVSAQEQLKDRVATSAGDLVAQDYYRLFPDDLPLDWGGAATGTSFRALAGAQRLQVRVSPVARFLLVVVTCPPADRAFTWRLPSGPDAGEVHRGRCGLMDGDAVRLPERTGDLVPLEVSVGGELDYGVTVLER